MEYWSVGGIPPVRRRKGSQQHLSIGQMRCELGQQRLPWWYYAPLGLVITALALQWIARSQVGTLQAVFMSLAAFISIGLVLKLGAQSRSGIVAAIAGIAVARIFAVACHSITGHWPHKGWSWE